MLLRPRVTPAPTGPSREHLVTAGPIHTLRVSPSSPPSPGFTPNMRVLYLASRHRISASFSRSQCRKSQSAKISRRRPKMSESDFSSSFADGSELERCKTAESDFVEAFEYIDLSDDENGNFESGNVKTTTENKFQRVYLYMCRRLGVVPSSSCLAGLTRQEIKLTNYDLGPKGVKSCCVALALNPGVVKLDLAGNSLGSMGTSYVADMLSENVYITDINLADNSIGSDGVEVLTKVLKSNEYIKRINLSGNDFEEKDALLFAEIIRDNHNLKELNLAHNCFREKGGQTLGPALADNTTLEVLDLSWNHLRRKGAVAVCDGLKNNIGLKSLNVAWNGFYLEGCKALHKALVANRTLTELDVSCNRIDRRCLDELLKGISRNEALLVLKVGENPLTTEGAVSILEVLQKKQTLPLKQLDITGQCVDAEFLRALARLRESRVLAVNYGNVLREDDVCGVRGSQTYVEGDPLVVVMEFLRLQTLRVADLFTTLQTDGSKTVTTKRFRQEIMRLNIPVSPEGLTLLINKLDANGDGQVDYGKLIQEQNEHERNLSEMLKKSKGKRADFEDQELSRISAQLQKALAVKLTAKKDALNKNRGSSRTILKQTPVTSSGSSRPSSPASSRRSTSQVLPRNSLLEGRPSTTPSTRAWRAAAQTRRAPSPGAVLGAVTAGGDGGGGAGGGGGGAGGGGGGGGGAGGGGLTVGRNLVTPPSTLSSASPTEVQSARGKLSRVT